jgi:cell wall-associated NlpC family hydrolase
MVSDDTFTGILDSTKRLTTPRSHRAKTNYSFVRPIILLLLLALASPFLVTSVLPQDAPVNPLSEPYTAQTYAPLDFPAPPYVEPSEPRTADVSKERASRAPAQTERKTVSKVEIVISFALAQTGKRYVFGAAGPSTFDCSGLVKAAFATIGMDLYHYTGKMMTYGKSVARSALQRGDIVFPSSGHVGIYLGNGKLIHASSGRERVVVDSSFSFYTARRLL